MSKENVFKIPSCEMENCDCAKVAGERVDELLHQLEVIRVQALKDRVELSRLREEAKNSTEQNPNNEPKLMNRVEPVMVQWMAI